jgi:hypothetical protein
MNTEWQSVRHLASALAAVALLASGCASTGNTLAQDLAWERWHKCNHFSGLTLNRIDRDGKIWVNYGDGFSDMGPWRACLQQAAADQASRRPVTATQQQSPVAVAAVSPFPAEMPSWKPGDEWAYRWESPQGKGTFVWSVDREEVLDGVTYYVVKAGARELFYRKTDFAFYIDRLNGQVETRHTPPAAFFTWPLVSGAKIEVRYTHERPLDRQSEEMVLTCETGAVESVTVPAGTFDAVKITCRNSRTNALVREWWLSSATKHYVRERAHFSYGVRERELIAVKLR